MKAAVFMEPGKMEVKEVDKPVCKDGEILVKVGACAICGTDVRIYFNGQKNVVPPHIIGHEIAGTIEEIGKGVSGYSIGGRVTTVTSVCCGKCKFCEKGYYNICVDSRAIGYFWPGGFAEYVSIPKDAVSQNSVIKIPDNVSFEEASIVEPLSCCINGQDYLDIQEGDFVVVFGCGPIGIMHAELAKAQGAASVVIADISEDKLQFGRGFKDIILLNVKEEDPVDKVMKLTGGEGADVVIVAAGSKKAQVQAMNMAAKKARVSFFAGLPKDDPIIELDSNLLHYREISVFGAFASYEAQYRKALNIVSAGKIESGKIITHTFPLDKIVEAIKLVKAGKTLKVVIKIEA